ncbi:hypothetical protein MAPG_10207 [Magnaporthiopsis poae ATCC 64411]|uniref:Mid2 domain-containing protein n=1 Tax=Magnaporthiopsis poae (strain ATCC 64411 / 73-15) TaxID=644358 RepID=A0A0C4EBZ5_MAGP6|nr:hypothetical protein MAPG_10207 [Magnaporthiopsis poae ATCC 64411]
MRAVRLVAGALLSMECQAAVPVPPVTQYFRGEGHIEKRQVESITARKDFLAWRSGADNTWTPDYCYGGSRSLTSFETLFGCCPDAFPCSFGITCDGLSIIQTVFETSRSRTLTSKCSGPAGVPYTCKTTVLLQTTGDPSPRKAYSCGLNGLDFAAATRILTLPAGAPVWITVPGDELSNTAGSRTTNTPATSTPAPTSRMTSRGTTDSSSTTTTSTQRTDTGLDTTNGQTPPPSNASSTGGSSGLSNAEKIGIGIGVGIGVPLILLAVLAWIYPEPLRRLRGGNSETAGSQQPEPHYGGKPELPDSQAAASPQTQDPAELLGGGGQAWELWARHTPVAEAPSGIEMPREMDGSRVLMRPA